MGHDGLQDWWEQTAKQDLADVLPKAAEYGSNSLEQVGRKVAALKGINVDKAQALELGCYFYALGKFERWTDAVLKGQLPSDDTILDLKIYCTMVQRIRQHGDWPGTTGSYSVNSVKVHDPDCQGIGKPCCSAPDIEGGSAYFTPLEAGPDSRTL